MSEILDTTGKFGKTRAFIRRLRPQIGVAGIVAMLVLMQVVALVITQLLNHQVLLAGHPATLFFEQHWEPRQWHWIALIVGIPAGFVLLLLSTVLDRKFRGGVLLVLGLVIAYFALTYAIGWLIWAVLQLVEGARTLYGF